MDASKKQRAKELYESKQFVECKDLLSELIQDGNANYVIYNRMAQICMQLREYDEAKKYFQISINENPTNASIYIKFGSLLSEHLNDYDFAQQMYEKASKLEPSNDLLWFNYGKLLYTVRNFDKAIQSYSKCIKERACVHYHFAKALLSLSNDSTADDITILKAKDKLQRATALKPNIAAYHHELALCLMKAKQYEAANQSFTICLQLSNHKDISMLYDYSDFLFQIYKDQSKAIEYQQMAHDLDANHEYNEENSEGIRLMIYAFDECIAYWNVNGINMEQLKQMQRMDIVVNIFGGVDRIQRLKTHFERINTHNIPLVILSTNHPDIIIHALNRVNLYHPYFENTPVVHMDISCNIEEQIIELSHRYNAKMQQILFIDSVSINIDIASNHCGTYRVFCDYILNGLTLKHMIEMERLIGVDMPLDDDPVFDEKLSLLQIDADVYSNLKSEVRGMDRRDTIDSLPVIQFIQENCENDEYKAAFIYFAVKYRAICHCDVRNDFWFMCNIYPQIIGISPTDSALLGRYAQCLVALKHDDAAEHYFKLAIKHKDIGLNYHLYGYFLYHNKRFMEAEKYFVKSIEYKRERHYYQSCLGYARTLEQMKQYEKADYYYRKAIQCNYTFGKMQYFYGIFLFNHHRYYDAKTQFEIAVENYPNSASNHFWLSKTLLQLKNFSRSTYHADQAFKRNPHLNETTSDWSRYHYDTYDVHDINETDSTHSYHNHSSFGPRFQDETNHLSNKTQRKGNIWNGSMEKHRHNMHIIAQNEAEIPLDQLPDVYAFYFSRNIKCDYQGKLKRLGLYFDDLFEVTHVHRTNKTWLISKIYNEQRKAITMIYNTRQHQEDVEYGHLTLLPIKTLRKDMEIIAQNESHFNLSQLPQMYTKYLNREFKYTGGGKCKRIALYFRDIFRLHVSVKNNSTMLISKLYKVSNNISKHETNETERVVINERMEEGAQMDHDIKKQETPSTEPVEDNTAIEFKRYWFDELSLSTTESFDTYYNDLVKHKMNDIACLFNDEIGTKLQDIIGVKSLQDLEFIMTHICTLKNENKLFIEILNSHNLDIHYPMFTENAIYTMKLLKCHLKCREDIQEMVESYTPGSNDDALITSIWNIRSTN